MTFSATPPGDDFACAAHAFDANALGQCVQCRAIDHVGRFAAQAGEDRVVRPLVATRVRDRAVWIDVDAPRLQEVAVRFERVHEAACRARSRDLVRRRRTGSIR